MSVEKKLVVVGDGACGKTCLLIAYTQNTFDAEGYTPTVFDTYVKDVQIRETTVDLSLWDTAGQEEYDRLRTLAYTNTDVILICFSVTWRDSFQNVKEKWLPEVRHFCPKIPILLVGTKVDLRNDQDTLKKCEERNKPLVTTKEAQNLALEIGAVGYIECSAKTKLNVEEVFREAANATLTVRRNKKRTCSLM